jgi:hypothetical protein
VIMLAAPALSNYLRLNIVARSLRKLVAAPVYTVARHDNNIDAASSPDITLSRLILRS